MTTHLPKKHSVYFPIAMLCGLILCWAPRQSEARAIHLKPPKTQPGVTQQIKRSLKNAGHSFDASARLSIELRYTRTKGKKKKLKIAAILSSKIDRREFTDFAILIGKGKNRRFSVGQKGLQKLNALVLKTKIPAAPKTPNPSASPSKDNANVERQEKHNQRTPEGEAENLSPQKATAEKIPTTNSSKNKFAEKFERRFDHSYAARRFNIRAGGGVYGRSFRYTDPISRNLREFSSGVSGVIAVSAAGYPFYFYHDNGSLKRLGLTGELSADFGQNPGIADIQGETLSHFFYDWSVNLDLRIDFPSILFGVSAGFGQHQARFEVPSSIPGGLELPSTAYQFMRLRADARYETRYLSISGAIGVRILGEKGRVGDNYFPNSAAVGLEIDLNVHRQLYKGLELYVGLRYYHYAYSLRPQIGDPFLAGGALDLSLVSSAGVAYAY